MSTEKNELRWYLCSTKKGKEVMASKALERVCVEVFLPLIYERHGHKPEPVFPHFVFVRVESKKRLLAVAYSAGMRAEASAPPDPVEIPDSLVAQLKAAAAREQPSGVASSSVSDAVGAIFNRKIASLNRTVELFRLIEERRALEPSASD